MNRMALAAGEPSAPGPLAARVLPALTWLDGLLAEAVATARVSYGPDAAGDPYRGLYVAGDEIDRLLARSPATSPLVDEARASEPVAPLPAADGLERLSDAFALSLLDLQVLVVAIAPHFDLRYERLFGFLQDDVTRRRPTVELALNLLCSSVDEKLRARERLGADLPLVGHELVRLVADPALVEPPLLARDLVADDLVVRAVLGQERLDPRLRAFARLVEAPAPVPPGVEGLPPGAAVAVERLAGETRERRRPLLLRLVGADREGTPAAAWMAGALGVPLLELDASALAASSREDVPPAVGLAAREARLRSALLHVQGLSSLSEDHARALVGALAAQAAGVIALSGDPHGDLDRELGERFDPLRVELPEVTAERRVAAWKTEVARAGLSTAEGALEEVGARFRLGPDQIVAAVRSAATAARWRAAAGGGAATSRFEADELFAAAREQGRHGLDALARKVPTAFGWADLVLPHDRLAQLHDIRDHVRYSSVVLEAWGLGGRLPLGRGLSVLFAGPSGTGKTMAATVLANDLGLDLYKIDLASVVSKYIGETEKNLSRIFAEAESSNAMLLFDEADALFGRRTEVRDSHDRYANVEVSYLLQRIEEYDGVSVLTTNFRKNMDDAFVRRLHFTIDFSVPDERQRREIWASFLSAEVPLDDEVDLDLLARRFELPGGHIRNIAVGAAFLAAANGKVVTMEHLLEATRREYRKLGKVVTRAEFAPGESVTGG